MYSERTDVCAILVNKIVPNKKLINFANQSLAASVTPQVSRKPAKNINKKNLEVEVNRLRGKEELYKSSLKELRDEIKSSKSTINELEKEREEYKPSRGLYKRITDLEK